MLYSSLCFLRVLCEYLCVLRRLNHLSITLNNNMTCYNFWVAGQFQNRSAEGKGNREDNPLNHTKLHETKDSLFVLFRVIWWIIFWLFLLSPMLISISN